VCLTIDKIPKLLYIHQIICWIFKGPRPSSKHTVDHIDQNKLNNSPLNLRWASPSEQGINTTRSRENKNPIQFDNILLEGEIFKKYNGTPLNPYIGPRIEISNKLRILRDNQLSIASTLCNGYPVITVNKKSIGLHQLQWILNNPGKELPEVVGHKNNDKTDYRPENLYATTLSENTIDAHNSGMIKTNRRKPVLMKDCEGNIIELFNSACEAGRWLKSQNLNNKEHQIVTNSINRGTIIGEKYRFYWA
jgi:hypothetical protein